MSAVIWQLTWTPAGGGNSETRTLEEWGITACTLVLSSQEADVLSFEIALASIDSYDIFTHKSEVTLWRDYQRWFTGTMRDPYATASGSSETKSFQAVNAWGRWAEGLPATQTWQKALGGSVEFGRCILFAEWEGTFDAGQLVLRSTADEISAFLAKGITLGAPWRVGTIDGGRTPVAEKCENLTIDAVIKRILRYVPDAVLWFDYTAAVGAPVLDPLIHCRRAADLSEVILDISETEELQFGAFREARVSRAVVTLKWQVDGGGTGPSRFNTTFIEKSWPKDSTDELEAIRVVFDYTTEFTELEAFALAKELYAGGQSLGWHGSFILIEDECTGRVRVGQRLNITGTRVDLASMNAIVQEVSFDITAGRTSVSFGPPQQIGPQDLQQLLAPMRAKIRAAWQEVLERDTGSSPESNYGMGEKDPAEPDGAKVRIEAISSATLAQKTIELGPGARVL